jgi:hypothetical protein
MITAHATGDDGRRIIVLGLVRENITAMLMGAPLRVSAETHPGFPTDVVITAFYGTTYADVRKQLEPLIGPETKIVIQPKGGGSQQ